VTHSISVLFDLSIKRLIDILLKSYASLLFCPPIAPDKLKKGNIKQGVYKSKSRTLKRDKIYATEENKRVGDNTCS